MQPFDPPAAGTRTGIQLGYDARRVHYLECLAKQAVIKSTVLEKWNAAERARNPAGHITVCDAVAAVGIEHLDPGLDAIGNRLRWMTPGQRAEQQRRWLEADNRVGAVGRALRGRAHPDRADELFGWRRAGLDPGAYWDKHLRAPHMELLLDTADFGANELLRVLYMLADTPQHLRDQALHWRDAAERHRDPHFPDDGEQKLRTLFTSFKYWFDDPFRCSEFTGHAKRARESRDLNGHEDMDPGADMTYWSENHRILFATAEYLAGQYWPDDHFVSARHHRIEGPNGPPRQGDKTGRAHRDSARVRVLRWLNERLRLGFAEWNAPGYYVEDILPLLNLVDFATDDDVRTRAAMVLDLLVFEVALGSVGGAFAGSAGRAYFEHKNCVWGQSIRDPAEVLFGARGHFVGASNAAVFLAISPRYRPPDALLVLGSDPPAGFTSRSRVSINVDEAAKHGVGFASADDMEFWWSRAAYSTKETVLGSRQVTTDHGLLQTKPFKDIIPMLETAAKVIDTAEDAGAGALGAVAGFAAGAALGGPVGAIAGAVAGAAGGASIPDFDLADAAELAAVIADGSVLSRANIYLHRAGSAQLASVQSFRPGQVNFQSWPCVAALGNGAMVWTSYPSAGTRLTLQIGPVEIDSELFPDGHDGPNWWTGNAVQPRVVQRGGAAITAYQAQDVQNLMFGQRTHAWFPKNQFDEVRGPEPARCNHDSARWFFGRAGDSYVALFTAREAGWATGGPWRDKEIRTEGQPNVFVTQIGCADDFGSFDTFVARVSLARLTVSGLHSSKPLRCSYDVPGGKRLELHYADGSAFGGRHLSDIGFPRYRSPFARVAWLQDRYAIRCGRYSVIHDVARGERTVGGRLEQLVHDTPLTFYAQNMALLPWPLYKGVDSDRALGHLIDVLRARRPDVVGLGEMWTSSDRERVCRELADIYPHTVEGPHEQLVDLLPTDAEVMGGGLLLLSAHPVVSSNATIYRRSSGDDGLTNKGVLHARVQPVGHPCEVDVFLTHTQAPHPTVGGTVAGAREAVRAQIRHLAGFIRSCRNVAAPAILFGDLNVDEFAHRDLYDFLIATLGGPIDLEPTLLAFPGLLYQQRVARARMVTEQWSAGRDMSDHYGVEATIDVTTELFPAQRTISRVSVQLALLRCLQTSSGLGDDEVRLRLSVNPSAGRTISRTTAEIEDLSEGDVRNVDAAPLTLGDPGAELELAVAATEVDTVVDDKLGRAFLTFDRDELLAMAAAGPTRVGFPRLLGGPGLFGGAAEYVVEVDITVEAK